MHLLQSAHIFNLLEQTDQYETVIMSRFDWLLVSIKHSVASCTARHTIIPPFSLSLSVFTLFTVNKSRFIRRGKQLLSTPLKFSL